MIARIRLLTIVLLAIVKMICYGQYAAAAQIIQDKMNIGGHGPEMVTIPVGQFIMGSAPDEHGRFPTEGPTHQVSINTAFFLSRYEITFAQYDRYVNSTGSRRPSDQGWGPAFWGRGNMPVFNVSWHEAVAYTRWLSQQTGQIYRLPSEAEWEYSARAGNKQAFTFGRCITKDQANFHAGYAYSDCAITELYRGQMIPVGKFFANPWGLYDVHGNAFEWTQDCWHDNYNGAPEDQAPWIKSIDTGNEYEYEDMAETDCRYRVLKGGSWSGRPRDIRFAQRAKNFATYSSIFIGFRIAREASVRE